VVHVKTSGGLKTEDSEVFLCDVYESLRDKYETAASLKTDIGRYNTSVEGTPPQVMSYPVNPYYPSLIPYPIMHMPTVASPTVQQTPVTVEQPAPDRSSVDIKGSCQLCESSKYWADKCPIRLYRPPTVVTETTDIDTEIARINTVTVGKVSQGIQTTSTRSIATQTMPEISNTDLTDSVVYTRVVSVHTGIDLSFRQINSCVNTHNKGICDSKIIQMINPITVSIINVADS